MAKKEFVIGVFSDLDRVNETIEALAGAGVDKKEIAVITKLEHPAEELIEDVEIKKADAHARSWAKLGAVAGGLLGLLVGGVVFTAPVVGPMMAAGASLSGAISGLLGGAVAGGALFGIADGLIEWGMASDDAKRMQKLVEEGKVLVIVRTDDAKEPAIKEAMEKSAEEVEVLA